MNELKTITLNGGLTFECPQEIAEMSLEELKSLLGVDYPNLWGIRDEEQGFVFCVMWKDSSNLLVKMTSTESLKKRQQKNAEKQIKGIGEFINTDIVSELAGVEARGFSCTYTAKDVARNAEVNVLKRDKTCYTLHYYTTVEKAEENDAIYEAIKASLRFA